MKKKVQVVVVAAIRQNGRYLLTKRYNPSTKLTHNTWQLPGGGLEFGEKVIQCLHREVKEETGLKVKIISLVPEVFDSVIHKWGWHGVIILFVCEPLGQNPKITLDKEATEYGWFTLKEALKLNLHFGTKELLENAGAIR